MNNKPVAWMQSKPNLVTGESMYFFKKEQTESNDIPLYTHPVKELKDEEIWKLWQEHLDDEIPAFAKAILRKAQEK
jgi:hypothetical protein